MKRGFTIVELMMVVAIIAVLATIVTTASVSSIRSSRVRRREAMRQTLQAAIATYHAQDQNEQWPGAIEDLAKAGTTAVLGESQAQDVFRDLVRQSIKKSGGTPLINPSGLFVAPTGAEDGKGTGINYLDARKGGAHRRKMSLNELEFGYPGRLSGKFHRFNIVYRAETDSVIVSDHCHRCCSTKGDGAFGSEEGGSFGVCDDDYCPVCHEGSRR